MLMMMFMIFLAAILTLFIYLLTFLLSFKMKKNQEKLSPFECGFTPIKTSRTPFSLRFFLLIVLFLIFDVELALIMPLALTVNFIWKPYFYYITFLLLFILIMGLMHEWNQNTLEWVN